MKIGQMFDDMVVFSPRAIYRLTSGGGHVVGYFYLVHSTYYTCTVSVVSV